MSGTSMKTFDESIQDFLKTNKLRRVLDIGSGLGKYGRMIRKIKKDAFIESIEIYKPHADKLLKKGYDKVNNTCVVKHFNDLTNLDETYDLIIFGDVLEHLPKADGITLLSKLTYISKYILIVFPQCWRQGAIQGKDSERHISQWSEWDFKGFHKYTYDEIKLSKTGSRSMVKVLLTNK